MDFRRDADLESFRLQVRGFLRDHLPASLARRKVGVRSEREDVVRWQRILHGQGWGAPYWPKEHGGTGWSVQQRLVFDEECAAAGSPSQDNFAHKLLGPVLHRFGTPAQKAEQIPLILRGERMWCQGFSEPGAGSDLASLRTRAVREGDVYVVEGQKIWTSYAHQADWIFMLVRTERLPRKQSGISFLLVDLRSPGITIRPIVSIDDRHHLNEVFFDKVRVPAAQLIGAEGEGWGVTKFLLNNEHASSADLPTVLRMLQQARALARSSRPGGVPLVGRPAFALRLARCEAEVCALRLFVQRVAALEADHSPATHALSSMLKLRATDLQQRLSELLVEALGDHGAVAFDTHLDEPDPSDRAAELPGTHRIASEMFFRRAATIYGGSSEVQRGIVAKAKFGF